jgi:hypothetical protein
VTSSGTHVHHAVAGIISLLGGVPYRAPGVGRQD